MNYLYIYHCFIHQEQSKKRFSYRLRNSFVMKKLQNRFSKGA